MPPRRAAMQPAIALLALVALTLAMLVFRDRLDKAHVALLYLLVILAGSAAGRVAGLTLGLAAFVLFNVFFLPPYNTLVVTDPLDWLVLVTFMVTSIVATELLNRQRVQAQLAERRRSELDQMATLGAETLNAARAEHALQAIARVIRVSVGVASCELYAGTNGERLRAIASSALPDVVAADPPGYVAESGRDVLTRRDGTTHVASESERPLTKLEPDTISYAMPLFVRGATVGVLRIVGTPELTLSADQLRVLNSLAYYAALALERLRLEAAEETAEQLRRADRLKDSLLAAVSHDLRTPLTTIKALAHEIAQQGSEPAQVIEEEADQLASMVEGLLQLSQLNAHAMPVRLEINTVDELVEAALTRASSILQQRTVVVTQPTDTLLIGRFDMTHSLRILVNLLENAAKYSPADAPIEIDVRRSGAQLRITVSDRGPGITEDECALIFQPFFRSSKTPADVRGAGLGLSIARQLADVQGGSLHATARAEGGTAFVLMLPAAEIGEGEMEQAALA